MATVAVSSDIGGVVRFNPHDDQSALAAKWKKWLRSFNLFILGKGVTDDRQKWALLLHCAGPDVVEIYDTLGVADDDFDEAVNQLTNYFTPKQNYPFERHLFRQLRQSDNESVAQFCTRLRTKASDCGFTHIDEAIRDQLIDAVRSHSLRKKFLERGETTLTTLLELAKTHELAQAQAAKMEGKALGVHINKLSLSHRRGGRSRTPVDSSSRSSPVSTAGVRCYRCNKVGHMSKDSNCPARGQTCKRCGKMDHFAVCCKTKSENRASAPNAYNNSSQGQSAHNVKSGGGRNFRGSKSKTYKVHAVEADSDSDSDGYVFGLKVDNESDDKVTVKVGGIETEMLIDSGASVNILDEERFMSLIEQGMTFTEGKVDKKLYAYGHSEPLSLKCKFSASVSLTSNTSEKGKEADFFVLKGIGPGLLGKKTATELGLLQMKTNPDICSLTEEIQNIYPECFKGVGKLKDYQLKLHIKTDVAPVAQRMYRVPYALRNQVSLKLDELEKNDIIEKVEGPSSWVSPMIVIPKPKSKDIRLVVDMRQANLAIIRDRQPIPTLEEVLYKMNGGAVFSKLDLNMAFHQIELDEESRDITTFVTHKGMYRYKRLSFGVSAAPEKYQHILSQVLDGIEGVQNLHDDICVFGRDEDDHDRALHMVMKRLKDKNLTLNKEKSVFKMDKITFMGHVLSKHGIGPTKERVKSLQDAERPTNASEVRSFLGIVNFSARYIPDVASLSEPLRKLTKKNVPFKWGTEHEKSFQQLKSSLVDEPTLGHFRLDASKTQLICDASNVGLCGILVQEYQGEKRVISYASRSLSDAEKKYSTTEKEALAVVWACEKYHIYLASLDFELIVDHKPLEALYGPRSKPCARIERWVMRLMPYRFTIRAVPGHQNIADYLSRLGVKKNPTEESNKSDEYAMFVAREATPCGITTREIEESSKIDPELLELRKCIKTGDWGKSTNPLFYPMKDEFMCIGYIVLRGHRIVVPKSLRHQCVELAHTGHLGIVKTKQHLRTKVWWPQMERDVEKYVKTCHGCQLVAAPNHPEPLEPTPLPNGPWQDIGIDFLGPLDSGQYVLVVVDYYSRYFEVEITKDTTSKKVIESLERMFLTHGLPRSLTSDNAAQFRSEEFEDFLVENRIYHRLTTPLHPSANGEVERQNRSLMKRIKIAKAESKDWKREIRTYLFAYRTTPHSVTGVTPAELMFGRKLRTKLPQLDDQSLQLDEEVRDRDAVNKYKSKQYTDNKRRAQESDLEVGEKVLLKQHVTGKLDTPFYPKPFKLVSKNGNSCVVESEGGARYKRNSTFVKKYLEGKTPLPETEVITEGELEENEGMQDRSLDKQSESGSTAMQSGISVRSPCVRSSREKKMPRKFDDYVMYK